jgi:hypothetical protein
MNIPSLWPKKQVLSNDEINSIVEFRDFANKEEEYARDVST